MVAWLLGHILLSAQKEHRRAYRHLIWSDGRIISCSSACLIVIPSKTAMPNFSPRTQNGINKKKKNTKWYFPQQIRTYLSLFSPRSIVTGLTILLWFICQFGHQAQALAGTSTAPTASRHRSWKCLHYNKKKWNALNPYVLIWRVHIVKCCDQKLQLCHLFMSKSFIFLYWLTT